MPFDGRTAIYREPDNTWWLDFRRQIRGPFESSEEAHSVLDDALRAEEGNDPAR